jgi:hypothetical protein
VRVRVVGIVVEAMLVLVIVKTDVIRSVEVVAVLSVTEEVLVKTVSVVPVLEIKNQHAELLHK